MKTNGKRLFLEPSDIDLVTRCLQGSNSAFDVLVKRHEKAVFGLCYRMLGNRDDAVDASQEAFLKAYHALQTFRHSSRFSTWLFGIANNACIDRLRKPDRRLVGSLEQVEEDGGERASPMPTPESVVMLRESERLILDALGQLPDRQRSTMVMFHFNHMSISEISRALCRPEGTVKSDLHHARETLRRKLKQVVVET